MSAKITAVKIEDWKAHLKRTRLSECVQFRRTLRAYGWQRVGRDDKGRPLWSHELSGAKWYEGHLYAQAKKWGVQTLEIPF